MTETSTPDQPGPDEAELNARHNAKMAKIKAARTR